MPDSDQIDDAHRHAFFKEGGTLRYKDVAMFGPIFVRRTDDFDGRREVTLMPGVKDPDLVFIVIG